MTEKAGPSACRLLGLPQVRENGFEGPKALLGIFIRDRRRDDHILALIPIGRRCDLMLRSELQRIDGTQDFMEVPTSRHRIGKCQLNLLVRPDDVHRANRRIVGWRAARGRVSSFGRQHVIEFRDLELIVANQRIIDGMPCRRFDIVLPPSMVGNRIHGNSDDLRASFAKLALESSHCPKLCGADGREVFRVREEYRPAIADELVEVDSSLSGLGLEIGRSIVDPKSHVFAPYKLTVATIAKVHIRGRPKIGSAALMTHQD